MYIRNAFDAESTTLLSNSTTLNPKEKKKKNSMNTSCIPVIDIKDFPGQSGKLIAACEEWGCFRIINHKIPLSLMSEMKAVGECLLSLPMEIKRKTFDGVVGKGYIPPSEINPLYESLGVYDIALPEVFHSFCDRLNASTHQRETILRYFKAVEELARDIGGKLVEALGLDIPEFMQGWPCQFRLLKYHFTPESVGSNGARMHSDLSYLTVLQDDESVGGLELVDKQSGEIIDVEPSPPGTLLVVLGDIAKAWSNGRFYNVKHQVQNKEGKPRVSVVAFFLGPKEAKVEAPLELVGSDLPHVYVPFGVEEYRMVRLSTRSSTGEALEHFRTTSSIKI